MNKETSSYKMKLISINDYYINSAGIDSFGVSPEDNNSIFLDIGNKKYVTTNPYFTLDSFKEFLFSETEDIIILKCEKVQVVKNLD